MLIYIVANLVVSFSYLA